MVGIAPQPTFELTDHNGVRVTETEYRGSIVMIFFGFTHCGMVCPRALERLSGVLDNLGDRAKYIRPLYITVDPDRDTPEVMKKFLAERAPAFTGLTGNTDQIDAAKSAFRVFAQRKHVPDAPDGYEVPHTAITYFLGPDGAFLAHIGDSVPAETVTRRVRDLIDSVASEPNDADH